MKPIHHGWFTEVTKLDDDNNILKLKELNIWESLGIEEKIETLREVVWKLLDEEKK